MIGVLAVEFNRGNVHAPDVIRSRIATPIIRSACPVRRGGRLLRARSDTFLSELDEAGRLELSSRLLSQRCHLSFLSPSVLNLRLGLSIMTPIGQQLSTLIEESCAAREYSSHDRCRIISWY